MRLPSDAFVLGEGPIRGDYLTWAFMPLRRIVPLRGTPSCAFGAALLQGPTHWGLSHMGFHAVTANCASSRHSILRLWRGPSPRACTRGLSHIGFHAAAANCASSRHSILRLWRGPSPRAYAQGLSHIGFHAVAANCASSRHSILRLWRGPSPRAYSRGIISHRLSCRCDELYLFEALYPAPLARPFSKGLRAGGIF